MEDLDWTITVTLALLVLGLLLAFNFTVLTADKCLINAVRGTQESKTSIVSELASEVSPLKWKHVRFGAALKTVYSAVWMS